MNRTFTPESFTQYLRRSTATAPEKITQSKVLVAENTLRHARAIFGDEEKLEPLQPATIVAKEARGAEYPDAPLVDTGALRDSLRAEVAGPLAAVGSDDPKMLFHELGTERGLPSRPVLQLAVIEAAEENLVIVRATARAIVTGSRLDIGPE